MNIMKKSTLIMILSLVLAVAIGVGSTLAYLQDTDADVNVMTLGSVYITQNEQERDADGKLVPFTPNKPAYPAVYEEIHWAPDGEGADVNGTEYKVFDDSIKNVIDKIVTVTNTGKSDAYVRTIVAIEAPDYDPNDLIHVNVNADIEYTAWAPVDIGGVKYVYSVFTYPEALAPQETSVPSLVQLFLDKKAKNEDIEKFGETWEVLVISQAVQTMGFEDSEDENETAANEALDAAFGVTDAANVKTWFEGIDEDDIGSPGEDWINNNPPTAVPEDANTIANQEELAAALANGGEYYLVESLNLEDEPMAVTAANTTIHLNGKTINAKSTSSTTSYGIDVKNGATLELKGDGLISFYATQPDIEWGGEGQPAYPGYANNTIRNYGKLIIDGPTIENKTAAGGASYAIDNYANSELIVNSGEIQGYDKVAIRMFSGTKNAPINVTINGGKIEGKRAVWIHVASSDSNVAPIHNLTVTGGTLTATSPEVEPAIYSYSYGNSFANVNVNITGGVFNGDVQFGGGYKGDQENVNITGGTFNGYLGRWLANDGWEDIDKP